MPIVLAGSDDGGDDDGGKGEGTHEEKAVENTKARPLKRKRL